MGWQVRGMDGKGRERKVNGTEWEKKRKGNWELEDGKERKA